MTNIIPNRAKATLLAVLMVVPLAAAALDLTLPPSAQLTHDTASDPASYRLPIDNWADEIGLPVQQIEGRITRQAWRIPGQSATTLQLLAPLRDQVAAAGYDIVHQCAAKICGGFDFRFATDVIQGPDMYVDLADYWFLAAIHRDRPDDAVALLVSRSFAAGYVQIIRAGGTSDARTTQAPAAQPVQVPLSADLGDFAAQIEAAGHIVLPDLQFASGSAGLGDGAIASLDALAAYLTARPNAQIVLVGHTDATGSLGGNTALSRRRAQAAMAYLTARGIPVARLSAEGAGYLSPLTTNATEAGRTANRRIEAVLLP